MPAGITTSSPTRATAAMHFATHALSAAQRGTCYVLLASTSAAAGRSATTWAGASCGIQRFVCPLALYVALESVALIDQNVLGLPGRLLHMLLPLHRPWQGQGRRRLRRGVHVLQGARGTHAQFHVLCAVVRGGGV